MCSENSPVEVLVDFPLMWESQHAADHPRILDGPPEVADLHPTVSVLHLHHALCDRKPLFGRGHHGTQPHLLDLVFVHMSLSRCIIFLVLEKSQI